MPSLKYSSDDTSKPFRRNISSHRIVASDPAVVMLGPRSDPIIVP